MLARPQNAFVVQLSDGLGNQLFQYALGRKLSLKHGAELYFDTSWYAPADGTAPYRELGIQFFDVKGHFGIDPEWHSYWTSQTATGRLMRKLERNVLPPQWRRVIRQSQSEALRGRAFDKRVLEAKPGTYLTGWWSSQRYFEGIEWELRSELQPRLPLSPRAGEFRTEFTEFDSVAVHVRRGDYAKLTEFGLLDADYYARAAELIALRVSAPRFYVFSDAPEEAQRLLQGVLPNLKTVVLEPGTSPAEELWTMSGCKHFINANSTFSWWGAWLSRNDDKIVVVPKKWYVGGGIEVKDIYPERWLCI